MDIPLLISNKGEKTKVDSSIYEILKHTTVGCTKGYFNVQQYEGKRNVRLHRLVMDLNGYSIPSGFHVDHIDRDPSNNQVSNLRIVTPSTNAKNRSKYLGTSSKYQHVCLTKGKWSVSINHVYYGQYEDELSAAWAAKIHREKVDGVLVNSDVECPEGFELYAMKRFKNKIHHFVNKRGNRYQVRRMIQKKKYTKTFDTIVEAESYAESIQKMQESYSTDEIDEIQILRNEDEIAIVTTNKGNKVLVSDEDWHELASYNWYETKPEGKQLFGYAVNGELGRMHRYILKTVDPSVIVDHLDGNPLNNQRNNLREASFSQNAQNRSIYNGTSGFIGVTLSKEQTYSARIYSDHEFYYLGTYKEIIVAAWVYDQVAIILYGPHASINNVKIDGWKLLISKDHNKTTYRAIEEKKEVYGKDTSTNYIGVCKQPHNFVAYITHENQRYHLGSYESAEQAAWTYDQVAKVFYTNENKQPKLNDIQSDQWSIKETTDKTGKRKFRSVRILQQISINK